MKSEIQRYWQPKELTIPRPIRDLEQLNPIQRCSEVICHSLLEFEYWISPKGTLREWLRFNLVVAIVLAIPAIIIVPVITYLLWQFATWSEYLGLIARNLLVFPVTFIVIITVTTGLVALAKGYLKKN